jgi:tetratricopeptide (TPR) repeat protein
MNFTEKKEKHNTSKTLYATKTTNAAILSIILGLGMNSMNAQQVETKLDFKKKIEKTDLIKRLTLESKYFNIPDEIFSKGEQILLSTYDNNQLVNLQGKTNFTKEDMLSFVNTVNKVISTKIESNELRTTKDPRTSLLARVIQTDQKFNSDTATTIYTSIAELYGLPFKYTQVQNHGKQFLRIKAQGNAFYINLNTGITLDDFEYVQKELIGDTRANLDSTRTMIDWQLNIANGLRVRGMTQEAINIYEELASENVDLSEVYSNLGIAYATKDSTDKAIFNFKKAIDLNPQNEQAYEQLLRTCIIERRFDEALGYASDASIKFQKNKNVQNYFNILVQDEISKLKAQKKL